MPGATRSSRRIGCGSCLALWPLPATIHAVNLTDGLDGLAAGSILPPFAVFVAICAQTLVPAARLPRPRAPAPCVGFLFYNRHPAKMFMGDTGSLALGALLVGSRDPERRNAAAA